MYFFFLKMLDVLPPKYNTYKTQVPLPDLKTVKEGSGCPQLTWGHFLSSHRPSPPLLLMVPRALTLRETWLVSSTTMWPLHGEDQDWDLLNSCHPAARGSYTATAGLDTGWTGPSLLGHRGCDTAITRVEGLLEVAEAILVLSQCGWQAQEGGREGAL